MYNASMLSVSLTIRLVTFMLIVSKNDGIIVYVAFIKVTSSCLYVLLM